MQAEVALLADRRKNRHNLLILREQPIERDLRRAFGPSPQRCGALFPPPLAELAGGFQDQLRDFVGMGDQREMA
jgi:hypothetical protein